MRAPLGKFEGTHYYHVVQWLYQQAGESFLDDELGESEGFGWYGKFSDKIKGRGPFHAICTENSQGFFTAVWFRTEAKLNAQWSEIELAYEEFCEEQDDE
jgi:hypothetical protein